MVTIPRTEEGKEQGIYSEEGREELMEDEDEITDLDEGFMQGYEEGEKLSECCNCGKVLKDKTVEEEIDGELLRFCSSECASAYDESHK